MIKFIKELFCMHKYKEIGKVQGTCSLYMCTKCHKTKEWGLSDAYMGIWL